MKVDKKRGTAINAPLKIFTVREKQVMLDLDLAVLYGVEVKRLNEQVKRNIERFPEFFCFQLTMEEYDNLRSQFATLKVQQGHHRKYSPYAFTEQGIAMLSAVLRSSTAIQVSIKIIEAFVEMRRFLQNHAQVFQRLQTVEQKQVSFESATEKNFDKLFNALEQSEVIPKQGIFFNGQVFDAYRFLSDLIRGAKKTIVLIDNYIDDTVLTHFNKRNQNVKVTFYTKVISKELTLDLKKFNTQYAPIEILEFKESHDRFLIIDDDKVYHIGASLKDLGKKWFAFSKIEFGAMDMLERLGIRR